VLTKTVFVKAFYFITGFGHEAFTVFFVVDGISAGLLLQQRHQQRIIAKNFYDRLLGTYCALLPGLVVGATLDLLGVRFFNGTGLYSDYPDFTKVTLTSGSFFGNMLMLEPFVVPTFGSNAMLHLFSYLWWSFVLLAAFSAAAHLRRPLANFTRAAVLLAPLFVMPLDLLQWIAIWLLGIGVAALGETRYARLPHLAGWGVFCIMIIASRLVRDDHALLPQPFGSMLISWKYLFVGIGFATLASAMSSGRPSAGAEAKLARPSSRLEGGLARDAFVTLFFHFPFLMLIAGAGADLLHQELMQQPSGYLYFGFAAIVFACFCLTTAIARATARGPSPIHVRIW
jgi:hypothetical protein